MGNRAGSEAKFANLDSDDRSKRSNVRKNAQINKGSDTEPPNRRRSSAGNTESNSTTPSTTTNNNTTTKKKSTSLLTEHQKQVVIRSWKSQINRHTVENIGVRTYLNVFENSPQIKRMFRFEDTSDNLLFDKRFQRQARAFVRVIDEAVRDIESLEEDVQKRLHALGARHTKFRSASFGPLKMQHWDTFAESMLEAIIESQSGGMHKYRDTAATWRIFISWIIGIMKQGYYEALRAERRATTAGLTHTTSTDNPSIHGVNCDSAPGSALISPHPRNHSVCYTPQSGDDLVQPVKQIPRSPLPPTHHHHHFNQSQSINQSQFLQPTTVLTSRSAPHSPYVINKQAQNHYNSRSSQQTAWPYTQTGLQGDFDAKDDVQRLQQPATRGNEEPRRMSRTYYTNYKHQVNEDHYNSIPDKQELMNNEYPRRYYCSDYY